MTKTYICKKIKQTVWRFNMKKRRKALEKFYTIHQTISFYVFYPSIVLPVVNVSEKSDSKQPPSVHTEYRMLE